MGTSESFATFGKYQLIDRLAFGGMAEVFLATIHGEAGFIKPVVIKRLHPRLNEDAEFVRMLIDEARITAQLTHSNICQVLDLGSVDGCYYLAMEYIDGKDLRTLQDHCIRNGVELPAEAAIHIVAEVLAGLDYAHRKQGPDGQSLGIIHRDVSPQNILISLEGEVKIIDFGIAKARQRLVQTEAGVIKGKFRYMSPEQASGGAVDHRTDVFAAGIVLYELLRGEPHSMQVSDSEVLRRMRRAEFPPLRQSCPNLPPPLEATVRRALHPKAVGRFPTAGSFRDALLRFQQATHVRYGRSELASFVQRLFEGERRRRRGSAAAEQIVLSPSAVNAMALPPPAKEGASSSASRAKEANSSRADGSGSRAAGWVAFAPTTQSVVEENPLRLAPTEAHTFETGGRGLVDQLTDPEQELDSAGDPPTAEDKLPTMAYYSHGRAEIIAERELERELEGELDEDTGAPTVVNMSRPTAGEGVRPSYPLASRLSSQSRSAGGARPYEEDLHHKPTSIVQDARPHLGEGERSLTATDGAVSLLGRSALPPASTEFFSRRALTAESFRPIAEEPRSRVPRVLIVLAVAGLVVGAGLLAFRLVARRDVTPRWSEGSATAGGNGAGGGSATAGARADALRADAQAQAQASGPGVIRVQSQPEGATIVLCGKPTGKVTPAELVASVGDQCVLELVLENHESYQLPVVTEPGKTINIVAMLRRRRVAATAPAAAQGTLRVTSLPPGRVYVDGRAVGETPRFELALQPGTYAVKVFFTASARYSPARTVKIRAGRLKHEHFTPRL